MHTMGADQKKFQSIAMLSLSALAFLSNIVTLGTFIAQLTQLPSIKNFLIKLILIAVFGGLGIFFASLARNPHNSALDKMLELFIGLFLSLFIISYFVASTTLFSHRIEFGYYIQLNIIVAMPVIIAILLPKMIQQYRLSKVYTTFGILTFASILIFSIQIAIHFFADNDIAFANFIYQFVYLSLGLFVGVWLYRSSSAF